MACNILVPLLQNDSVRSLVVTLESSRSPVPFQEQERPAWHGRAGT